MNTKQDRRTQRFHAVVERVRVLTNSGTREHNAGLSTDAIDRVGRVRQGCSRRS
jgi:hypothetical protein